MTTDFLFDSEDPDHFEEGLVHLVDMLELADPRREQADQTKRKVEESGIMLPTGDSLDEWKSFCQDVVKQLRGTRAQLNTAEGRAHLDAAIDRIELMTEDF